MKILFVDDDEYVLKSLKRTMLATDYEIYTASTVDKALALLLEHSMDVVISDVKMSSVNGIDLLRIVKTEYPDTYRMILSGFSEKENSLICVINSLSLDYITKPWNNIELLEKINNVINLRKILLDPVLISKVSAQIDLPSTPQICHEIQNRIYDGAFQTEIVKIIEKDITLSSIILNLANNSFLSSMPIRSIQTVFQLIGVSGIRQFLMAAVIIDDHTLEEWQIKELNNLANIASQTTKLFTVLYNYCYDAVLKNEFSFLAFCIDIGRVILLKNSPELYLKIKSEMIETGESFRACERKLFDQENMSSKLGGLILNKWNFSRVCIETSLFIDAPQNASSDCSAIIKLLNIAYANINNNDAMFNLISKSDQWNDIYIFELPFSRRDIKNIEALSRKNEIVL